MLHLLQLVHLEQELPVTGTGEELELGIATVADDKTRVTELLLAAHALQISLPTLAVGRVGDHEIECARRELVGRQGGFIRAADDVLSFRTFALQKQIGLADGVGFVADLLAKQVNGNLLAMLLGQRVQHFLGHGQHAAGAATTVVERIGAGLNALGHRQKQQLGHELHHVARGEVLARLFVVVFVETADQLLEHRAHAVVVQRRQLDAAVGILHRQRRKIDLRVEEVFNQVTENMGIHQLLDLVAEVELAEDLLHVGRETVQIRNEVITQTLPCRAGLELGQREYRDVVKRLTRRHTQRAVLLSHLVGVEELFAFQHRLLRRFEYSVKPSQHGERQDHVAVFAAHIDITQAVVSDVPDEVGNPLDLALVLLSFLHRYVSQLAAVPVATASFQGSLRTPTRRCWHSARNVGGPRVF